MERYFVKQDSKGIWYALSPDDFLGYLSRSKTVAEVARFKLNEEQIGDWNLKEFSEVIFNDGVIISVDGATSPEESRARLDFKGDMVDGRMVHAPDEHIDMSSSGDFDLCMMEALVQLGWGSDLRVNGPARVGKTTIVRKITKHLIREAQIRAETLGKKVALVFLDLEREKDATEKGLIIKNMLLNPITPPPRRGVFQEEAPRIEFYYSDDATTGVRNARFTFQRVRRLIEAGYDVVFIWDSLWAFCRFLTEIYGENGGGLIGAAIARKAITEARLYLNSGKILLPNDQVVTLTPIIVSLNEGERSGSDAVDKELGAQTALSQLKLRDERPGTPRPWFDVSSRTGELARLLGYGTPRYELQEELSAFLTEKPPREAMEWLRELFTERPEFDIEFIRARIMREKKIAAQKGFAKDMRAVIDLATLVLRRGIATPDQLKGLALQLAKQLALDLKDLAMYFAEKAGFTVVDPSVLQGMEVAVAEAEQQVEEAKRRAEQFRVELGATIAAAEVAMPRNEVVDIITAFGQKLHELGLIVKPPSKFAVKKLLQHGLGPSEIVEALLENSAPPTEGEEAKENGFVVL